MGFYGSPFEADYEKVTVDIGTDGQRVASRELYRLYVDSKGRWRMEGSRTHEGKTVRFAFRQRTIYIPLNRVAFGATLGLALAVERSCWWSSIDLPGADGHLDRQAADLRHHDP